MDPSGPRTWRWQAGGCFEVRSASGSAQAFAGGRIYASEPFLGSEDEVRISFITVPESARALGALVALVATLLAAPWRRGLAHGRSGEGAVRRLAHLASPPEMPDIAAGRRRARQEGGPP